MWLCVVLGPEEYTRGFVSVLFFWMTLEWLVNFSVPIPWIFDLVVCFSWF